MKCFYCKDEIKTTRNAYRRVTGWAQARNAGGTNHVALREVTDEWACMHCIDRLKRGIAIGQGTLV